MTRLVYLSISLMRFTVSCKKEGCINENVTNFDKEAKKDDGSCHYEAKTSFWYNEGVSGFLTDA